MSVMWAELESTERETVRLEAMQAEAIDAIKNRPDQVESARYGLKNSLLTMEGRYNALADQVDNTTKCLESFREQMDVVDKWSRTAKSMNCKMMSVGVQQPSTTCRYY
jgi:hypothetical protein